MTTISLWQLETVATFLETSREYLGVEDNIRLHWPRASTTARCGDKAASSRSAGKARTSGLRPANGAPRRLGT